MAITEKINVPASGVRGAIADAAVLAGLLLGLCVAYGSVLYFRYGYLDDYFWLDLAAHHSADLFAAQAVQGRPLNAIVLQWAFSHAGGIGGLRWVRALILVEMAGMGWIFYLAMKRGGWGRPVAEVVAGLACLVPAMQVYAAWATSVANPLSGILACCAAMLTWTALDEAPKRSLLLLLASMLMLASATIYQPTAMVFWPIAAVDLLRVNQDSRFKRFVVYSIVAGVGLLLAYGVFRHGLAHFQIRPSPKRSSLTHHPIDKLDWFLHHPLIDSLNLFNLQPRLWIAVCAGVILIVGLLRHFSGGAMARLTGLAVAAALFPLAYLPNLLVQENWASYRTQIGLSWLVLVLGVMAIRSLWPMRRLGLGLATVVLFVAGEIASQQVMLLIALPQAMELLRFTDLVKTQARSATQIILLQPSGTAPPATYMRYDEFGRYSLEATWVPQSAVNLIRWEADPNAPRVPVILMPHFQGAWTKPLPPGSVVIDMRGL